MIFSSTILAGYELPANTYESPSNSIFIDREYVRKLLHRQYFYKRYKKWWKFTFFDKVSIFWDINSILKTSSCILI